MEPGSLGDDFVQVVLHLGCANDVSASSGDAASLVRDVKCRSMPKPDLRGDFLADISGDNFAADLVHCFTASRLALQPFLDDRERFFGVREKWTWAFKTAKPLRIIAHAGEREDSCYHRGTGSLKFFHVASAEGKNYLCRGFDVVAHETGHAILDALNPSLYSAKVGQVAAFHEAFADVVAVFTQISIDALAGPAFDRCEGDLSAAPSLTAVGSGVVEFHAARSAPRGGSISTDDAGAVGGDDRADEASVRNLSNSVNGFSCSRGVYALASLFSGFVWDVVVALYTALGRKNLASLQDVVRFVRVLLTIVVLKDVSGKDLTFSRIAAAMSERSSEVADLLASAADQRLDPQLVKSIVEQCAKSRQLDAVNMTKARFRASLLGDF